jgi:hypothetical protein
MSRFYLPYETVVDADGNPMVGAKLTFYLSGTSTPATTYSDEPRSIANTNPVISNASGQFGAIWLRTGSYKVTLHDSSDVLQWTSDPVTADSSGQESGEETGIVPATITTWLTGMLSFLNTYTAASGTYIMNAQYIVRNNMHDELGRAGYLPPSASTSESQTMMIRGLLWAYKATGTAAYLTKAKQLAEAFISVYARAVDPPASGLWGHHWVINAGPSTVAVQGPAADPYTGAGHIGANIAFTAGVGSLGSSLALVYKVFTGTVGWENVYAGLNEGSLEYDVDYYIASDGTKRTGRKADGGWGETIGAVTGEPAGKIVLTNTSVTATLRVSYSVYTGATIAVNTGFEAWPMWRELVTGSSGTEMVMATDAIHWALDAFRLLKAAEPSEVRWQRAVARLIDTYEDAATYQTDLNIFKQDAGAQWNSQPLTYWFGLRGSTSFHHPDATVTASRDGSGYVQFDLGADGTRSGFYFENGDLLLTTISTSVMTAELGSNAVVNCEITVTNASGTSGAHTVSLAGTGIETKTIQLAEFRTWNADAWKAGDTDFVWGTASDTAQTNTDGSVPWSVRRVTVPDNASGWGVVDTWAVPAKVYIRGRTGATKMRLTDGAGWHWYKDLSNTSTLTETVLDWSSGWTTTGFQDNVGTPPASAVGNTITTFALITASTLEADVAWISVSTPVSLSAGLLDKVTLKWSTTSAIQLKVGDVSFSGATRPAISYQPGAAPFNYGLYGGSKRGPGGAFFQGPIYTAYQSINPWFEDGNVTAARNVYDLWDDAQAAYHTATGVLGPFAPVYIPPTYDSLDYGDAGDWTWSGPDPNTTWGGFQYRTFYEASLGWSQYGDSVPLAAGVCTKFLTWLDDALTANTAWPAVPSHFPSNAAPYVQDVDTHAMALCLRGTVNCRLAGADANLCNRTIRRLLAMLTNKYNSTGTMAGSFPPTAGVATYYGFWHGEIMSALGECLYWYNQGDLD